MSRGDGNGFANSKEVHMNEEQQHDDLKIVEELKEAGDRIRTEISKVIIGQQDVIQQLLTVLLANGHALLIGVPGLAKTLLINTLSRTLDLKFSRIQFTPDLMPSDITGTEILEEDRTTGHREFKFIRGPIFANVILADEVNRTPPKTQAALLQAMQEHEVTAAGRVHEARRTLFRPGDAKSHRTGRHLSAARSPVGPLHVQYLHGLSVPH